MSKRRRGIAGGERERERERESAQKRAASAKNTAQHYRGYETTQERIGAGARERVKEEK